MSIEGLIKLAEEALHDKPDEDRKRILNELEMHVNEIYNQFLEMLTKLRENSNNKGEWMSVTEIMNAGANISKASVYKTLNERKDIFKTRRMGRALKVFITRDNAQEVGLGKEQGGKIAVKIGDESYQINTKKFYQVKDIRKYLSKINPIIFRNANTIINLVKKIGENGVVHGDKLAEFIENAKGIRLLSLEDTQELLGTKIGLPYTEITSLWNDERFQKYIHSMQDIFTGTFLKDDEIDDLVSDAKKYGYNNLQLRQELTKCRKMLTSKGIMPFGKTHEYLLDVGVFDESSAENVRQTYEAFERAMEGFQFYNFNHIMETKKMGWRDLIEGPIKDLVEKGLARDVIDYLGMNSRKKFYVIVKGKKKEVEEFFDLES